MVKDNQKGGIMSGVTVTEEKVDDIFRQSEAVIYEKVFGKTTVVIVKLPNGFIIVESSSCVDPANYDHDIGVELCKKRIKEKIWELEGYLLQDKVFRG
jgi:hypothetical protein